MSLIIAAQNKPVLIMRLVLNHAD